MILCHETFIYTCGEIVGTIVYMLAFFVMLAYVIVVLKVLVNLLGHTSVTLLVLNML